MPLARRFAFPHNWSVPAIVLLLGGGAVVAVHAGLLRISDNPALDFLVLLVITEVLAFGWLIWRSGMSEDRRLLAIVTFGVVQTGLFQLLRVEGYTGDRRPIWTWSWLRSESEQIDWNEHRQAVATAASGEAPVDLSRETPLDWHSFRGSDRTGRAANVNLSRDWEARPPRLLWKQPIGAGWSSFVIVGDFCVTQEQRGEHEATVCYELQSGRERWAHYDEAHFFEVTSDDGPRATPTIDRGRVYALGATGVLNCLDGATGRPIWTVNILQDNKAENRLFGVTNSPLVIESLVIVNPGGIGSSLAAYDVDTGECLWRGGFAGASYSSPQPAQLCGTEQVLDFNADGLFAHDRSSGKVLWSIPWISNPRERNNVCQPVIVSGVGGEPGEAVFIASGYGVGCGLFDIRKTEDKFEVIERWRNRNLKAKFSSVVEKDGFVYGLDEAILTCIDLATGKRCWKGGHYNYGQLLLASDVLLVQLESGEVAMVDASPAAFVELGRFEALSDRTWNHPALAGRYLVLRNDREAACYELPLD